MDEGSASCDRPGGAQEDTFAAQTQLILDLYDHIPNDGREKFADKVEKLTKTGTSSAQPTRPHTPHVPPSSDQQLARREEEAVEFEARESSGELAQGVVVTSQSVQPTLRDLVCFAVPRVTPKWYDVGIALEVQSFILDGIVHDQKSTDQPRTMFITWLQKSHGTGSQPRTWNSIFDAVGLICGQGVVEEIQTAIQAKKCPTTDHEETKTTEHSSALELQRKRRRSSTHSSEEFELERQLKAKKQLHEYVDLKMDLLDQDKSDLHSESDPKVIIKLLYSNALAVLTELLEPHLEAVKKAAGRCHHLELHQGAVKESAIRSADSVDSLLNQMSVTGMWDKTRFLRKAVGSIPRSAPERGVADAILSHYHLHLAIYERATLLKDALAKESESEEEGKAPREDTKLVPLAITTSKAFNKFTCEDCHRLQMQILSTEYGIPEEQIICDSVEERSSTTVTFLIPCQYTNNILEHSTRLDTVWILLQLRIFEVSIPGVFAFNPSIGYFLTLLKGRKAFTVDLLRVTEILPYQTYCLVDLDTKEPLSGRPLSSKKIEQLWESNDESELDPQSSVPESEDKILAMHSADVVISPEDTGVGVPDEAPSRVCKLEEKVKDLERKVANLFMDNVALTTKLKASRLVEEQQQQEKTTSLEERLVQALRAQETATQERSLAKSEKLRLEDNVKSLEAENADLTASVDKLEKQIMQLEEIRPRDVEQLIESADVVISPEDTGVGVPDEAPSRVCELEEKVKDLERKAANLFMDNVALTTKLKASRLVEEQQQEKTTSLEERLVHSLRAQETATQERSLAKSEKLRLEDNVKSLEAENADLTASVDKLEKQIMQLEEIRPRDVEQLIESADVVISPEDTGVGAPDEAPSRVCDLEEKVKNLEQKIANLFMDNVALTTKLKASRGVEAQQQEKTTSLEERLVQALRAQETATQERSLAKSEKLRLEDNVKSLEADKSDLETAIDKLEKRIMQLEEIRPSDIEHLMKFEVPSGSVGQIIGKKGWRRKTIEEEAQLKAFSIKISRYETVPGMQTVSIKGQRGNCEAAKSRIEELVEFSSKRNRQREASHEVATWQQEEITRLKEQLGQAWRALETATQERSLAKSEKSLLEGMLVTSLDPVNSHLETAVDEPEKQIWKLEDIRPSDIEQLMKFEVPFSSVGLIIGARGRQLRTIEEEAQLEKYSIKILRETVPGMNMVTIKGQQFKCEVAKHKIEELVELSMKRKHHNWIKVGQSSVARRVVKYLSFITFLKDSDEIVFKYYKGIPPSNRNLLRDADMYFLEACEQIASMPPLEDLHYRLRNYHRLQETLHTAMDARLRSDKVYLKVEARFGKVLWGIAGQSSVTDEVLSGKYKIKDLERGGKVSVDAVLGGRDVRWIFQTVLSDATILESVKDAGFPVIGDITRLDITVQYHRGLAVQEYLIRMKQNKEMPKNAFEILEVLVKPVRPYVFDCLNLERDLDMRIGVSCSPHNEDTAAAAEMNKIAEELCHGMALREGCLYVKEPPGCSIKYARKAKQTMYLVSHHDKVHGECQYILALYQVEDSTYPEKSESTTGGKEVKLQLKNEHHEVELWNCQWMADFAVLVGQTPEEAFALKCCDPSKIKVRPKDKSEVTAASVIRELDPFVGCALQLALIDRD